MTVKPMQRITTNKEIIEALTPVPDFKTRDEIKPWVLEKMEPRGINLVIERSDSSKVVFKCKNIHRKSSSTGRLLKSNSVSSSSSNNGKPAKRIRNVPEDSCPFRLRVSYSVKQKVWSANVIKFEHNPNICCNFGDHSPSEFSPSSATPGSTKRSWSSSVYTPVSTVSPAFSSPSGSFTPSSEISGYNDYDFLSAGNVKFNMKKQKVSSTFNNANNNGFYGSSPLYQEVDPLSENLSLLPEDLSDINHFYESSQDVNLINTLPLTNFDAPLDFTLDSENNSYPHNFNQQIFSEKNHLDQPSSLPTTQKPQLPTKPSTATANPRFRTPIQPKPKTLQPKLAKKPTAIAPKKEFVSTLSVLSEPLIMQQHGQKYNNDPLNLNLNLSMDSVTGSSVDDETDPLMYLLNVNGPVANSNYTLEELENLDKAMGFDANDKLLMNMFQGM